MTENFQIRDVFNYENIQALADRLAKAWKGFDKKRFTKNIFAKLPDLTYSERISLITDELEAHLPKEFPASVKILLKAQLPPYATDVLENSKDRFITVPLTEYISRNGLGHFDVSMNALYEMTQRLTSEWAIRIFLEKYPDQTLAVLKTWATDPNPHVRRLVSEGSRPFLPWGKRLHQFKDNPMLTIELLEILKNDSSEYVRRSVANHLNDHAKNHPDLTVKILKKWKEEHPGKNMESLVKHATRTLVKDGHAGALELIGFKKDAIAQVENLKVDENIETGNYLNFSFDVISTDSKKQKLVIDYVIYFQKSDRSLSPKVFKLTTKEIGIKESLSFQKRHSFKIITTRVFYPGKHKLAIQINGVEKAEAHFNLSNNQK